MSRFLLIDVGAGTMDVLYFDEQTDLGYKAVVQSPVQSIARQLTDISGNLIVTGCEMGGGPVTQVLRDRAKTDQVVISESAAATLHHDLDRVSDWGISVVSDKQSQSFQKRSDYHHLCLRDIDRDWLERIVTSFKVPFSFDIVGICAQDHGVPPAGISHLEYRHRLYRTRLDQSPQPHALLYSATQVPPTMNRLASIAHSAADLPTQEVYVMDSGMAAILGATMDMSTHHKKNRLVLDIATSHTVGAAVQGDQLAGFFEYHTRDITLSRLESLLMDLADGKLTHDQIIDEGGHGAYIRKAFGFKNTEIIVATGPKRKMLQGSRLPITFGAPWGDNMMTGTVGLLEAIRRRKDLPSMSYV